MLLSDAQQAATLSAVVRPECGQHCTRRQAGDDLAGLAGDGARRSHSL